METLKEILNFECEERDQTMLMKDVTAEEIKTVIFKMARNKSPGPDGYTCEFYKTAWPIVGNEVVVAVTSFFEYGFLPKGVNSIGFDPHDRRSHLFQRLSVYLML